MVFAREIFIKLEKELKTPEVVVVTGLRQVGKTTLLNFFFDKIESANKVLLDLENPLHRKLFEEENYDNVWRNLSQFGISRSEKAFIFLDEIQNLPEISSVIKYLYDHWQVKFFVTGSSSFYLKNLFPESLAGRKVIYELFPLNFREFLIFKGIEKDFSEEFSQKASLKNKVSYEIYRKYYDEFIEFGGFPRVVLENDRRRKEILLEEIFTSYFEKDVKNLSDFGEISKLRDLIIILATRVGSKVDVVKIASEISISRPTLYNYLSFLEATYFVSFIPKFSSSADRRISGNKKLYFADCGMANFLGRISQGQVFENSVFQNLRTRYKLAFYNFKGKEIDFIVDDKYAIEVKISASQRDYSNLARRSKLLGLRENYIVSLSFSNYKNCLLAVDL